MTKYIVPVPVPTTGLSGSTYTYTNVYQLAITAGASYVQILKIERNCYGRFGTNAKPLGLPYSLTQLIGATISGGSGTIIPRPLRSWASLALSVCRYAKATDTYNSGTGAQVFTSTPIVISGGTSNVLRSEDVDPPTSAGPQQLDYQFPNAYIVPPGSTFLISGVANNGTAPGSPPAYSGYMGFNVLNVYLDEQNLARSA